VGTVILMYESLIKMGICSILGGTSGGLASWRMMRRRLRRVSVRSTLPVDLDRDDWAEKAAEQWSRANDRPEARGLVASRLRLGAALIERHSHLRRRR
jgi:hypothetical protein